MAFVYFPNGAIPSTWWPKAEGTEFEFNNTMKPLENLKNQVQVLGGLDHINATPGPDGAGDHARAMERSSRVCGCGKRRAPIFTRAFRSIKWLPSRLGISRAFHRWNYRANRPDARAIAIPAIPAPINTTSPGAAHDAGGAGGESAAGVRAIVWRRLARAPQRRTPSGSSSSNRCSISCSTTPGRCKRNWEAAISKSSTTI